MVSEQSETNGLTSFVVWLMLAGLIPSVEDKLKLRAAGLGEREITLDRGWSAILLHEKLYYQKHILSFVMEEDMNF